MMVKSRLISIVQGCGLNKVEIIYDRSTGEGAGITKSGPIPIALPQTYDPSKELQNRRQYFVEAQYFEELVKAAKRVFFLAEESLDETPGSSRARQNFYILYKDNFKWNNNLW